MRDYIKSACEEIDAAMFSGDTFEDAEERDRLKKYLDRWQRGIVAIAMAMLIEEG